MSLTDISILNDDNRLFTAQLDKRCLGKLRIFQNRWHHHPRKYNLHLSDFSVGSFEESRLVLTALWSEVVRVLEPHQPLLFRAGVEEDNPLLPALRELGFREVRRVYEPTLDVQMFDLSALATVEAEFKALGYHIVTLSDLTLTPTLEQQLYELDREVYSDTSTVDPATFPPLEQWREDRLQDEDLISDAFFIAVLENQFIGYGNLWRGEREDELETGTFGTARAFRHHHHEIMLHIKAREIAYDKAQGYKTIRAEIDAENPWTLYICAELPFVQGKDYVSMVRVTNWTVR